MRDINFDSRGMTNDCPLVADRSIGECNNCHHLIIFNNNMWKAICNFPGARGKPRTWFYKVNQWVDEDSVTYKVLEMHLLMNKVTILGKDVTAFHARYVEDAIAKARDIAKHKHCNFLDIDCPKGSGGRKVIVLR